MPVEKLGKKRKPATGKKRKKKNFAKSAVKGVGGSLAVASSTSVSLCLPGPCVGPVWFGVLLVSAWPAIYDPISK